MPQDICDVKGALYEQLKCLMRLFPHINQLVRSRFGSSDGTIRGLWNSLARLTQIFKLQEIKDALFKLINTIIPGENSHVSIQNSLQQSLPQSQQISNTSIGRSKANAQETSSLPRTEAKTRIETNLHEGSAFNIETTTSDGSNGIHSESSRSNGIKCEIARETDLSEERSNSSSNGRESDLEAENSRLRAEIKRYERKVELYERAREHGKRAREHGKRAREHGKLALQSCKETIKDAFMVGAGLGSTFGVTIAQIEEIQELYKQGYLPEDKEDPVIKTFLKIAEATESK